MSDAIQKELARRKQELDELELKSQVIREVITSLKRILSSSNSKASGTPSTKKGSAADDVIRLLQDGKLRNNAEVRRDLGVGNEKKVVNRYRTAIYHLYKRRILERMHDGRFRLATTK